jgi:hypothetical protein
MEIPIMAHFAELNSDNIVMRVLAVANDMVKDEQGNEQEQIGIDFLQNLFGAHTIWMQTSYNTRAGIYYVANTSEPASDQSQAFRKNFAGIGYTYDLSRDAFINPKPVVDADMEQYVTFDEFACLWSYNPPVTDNANV